MIPAPWFNFAAALTIGMLIGLERERSKGDGPSRRPAGIRTFALTSLLGAVAVHIGGVTLLAIAAGGVAVLAALAYFRAPDTDRGLTTEVGLMATPLLGGLAMSDPLLAAALGAIVTVVFAAKTPLHGFVTRILTSAEVRDGLIFAVATLVIWPLLPNRYMGPMLALNPHSIWMLVILVLALGAGGHIATRLFGQRFGLPLAGLASGFISSTATIGSMAGRAARDPGSMEAAVAGAMFSTVATFAQMALVLLVTHPPTFQILWPALAAGGAAAAAYGTMAMLRATASDDDAEPEAGRTFSITAALALAAMMAVMLVGQSFLKEWFGETGVIAGATLGGFVDTHSAAISIASLAAADRLTPLATVVPILAAMTSNAVSKTVMAITAGSGAFALRLVPGIVLSMAAPWAVALALLLR